ncbi:MAG: insulinase family protein, partial [Actinomycetota bacterium]|nr:insulinase family protein [Actinomycetota bacterium]
MTPTTAPTAAPRDTGAPALTQARPVPALGKARVPRLPTVGEQVLDNGLRVLVVRRPGVPLTELRLR